ncbi:MAG: hypothetical protein ACFBSC_02640 [Microcoleaceae cyanobacterium]
MKVIEHTSNRLVLKNLAVKVWITRAISGLFFGVGGLATFLIILALIEGEPIDFIGFLFAGIFLCLGLFIGLFAAQKIVSFDRVTGKATIRTLRLFSRNTVEYHLEEITGLRTKQKRRHRSGGSVYYSCNIILTLNHAEQIPLSGHDLVKRDATKTKGLIQDFLNSPH